jgi:DUF917 family protein
MLTYAALRPDPLALTNGTIDRILHPRDIAEAEQEIRNDLASIAFGNFGVVSLWPMSIADVQQHAILGGLTFALKLGAAMRDAQAAHASVLDVVSMHLEATPLVQGVVRSVDNNNVQRGLSIGRVIIDDGSGNYMTIYNLNENVKAVDSATQRVRAEGPDLICYLGADGNPLTNTEIAVGQEIIVLTSKAPAQMRSPGILRAFRSAERQASSYDFKGAVANVA